MDIKVRPRSKLVRDPASFGYRRLLPFLNKMAAKNAVSDGKDTPLEPKVPVSANRELDRCEPGLGGESVDGSGSKGGAAPGDSVAVEGAGDREMQDCSDAVNEEAKIISGDLASSKPCVARCVRSKFVHHPSSFSYKRMLPFLRENEISSQEEDRTKIRRVSEEENITSDESDVLRASPEEGSRAEADRVVEEVTEVLLDGSSTAEVQRATQEQVLASIGEPVSSDMSAVLAGGQCQPAVSEDSPE